MDNNNNHTNNHVDRQPLPALTVGVMGSAGGDIAAEVRAKVRCLGEEIARRKYVLVTGAAPGLPHDAVLGAKAAGGFVVGISPALDLEEHVQKYHSPTRGYDVMIYTGSGLMGREIENIRSCDVVIFAGGRSGTLGEFAIAYDEGKVIGALTGTGGITDYLDAIIAIMRKKTDAVIAYNSDPVALLDELEVIYNERILPKYLETIKGHNPDGALELERR
ncbi:MAG: LOG family protein [Chloroflexi bacterium]|nr:LOG family protein [Chloroflexota bacterium]